MKRNVLEYVKKLTLGGRSASVYVTAPSQRCRGARPLALPVTRWFSDKQTSPWPPCQACCELDFPLEDLEPLRCIVHNQHSTSEQWPAALVARSVLPALITYDLGGLLLQMSATAARTTAVLSHFREWLRIPFCIMTSRWVFNNRYGCSTLSCRCIELSNKSKLVWIITSTA